MFVGTNKGLYRLNSDVWEQLPVESFITARSYKDVWEQMPVEPFIAVHSLSQVYNLGIENGLKQGWSLKDPLGGIISEEGKALEKKKTLSCPHVLGCLG